ncbi:MAG: porin family protein [Gemmatimonadota bacterium]
MKATWVGIIAAALWVPPPVTAQSHEITLGVTGGFSFADVKTDDPELGDTFRRNAVAGGVFMSFRANDRIVVVPNLLYQQQGFRVDNADADATFKVDYVTLPLLLQVDLTQANRLRPRIFAGPSIGFQALCGVSGIVDGVDDDYDCDDPEIDVNTATTVYALVVGAGVDWQVGRWILGVEGRYDYGLTDLDVDPQAPMQKLRTYSILGRISLGFSEM